MVWESGRVTVFGVFAVARSVIVILKYSAQSIVALFHRHKIREFLSINPATETGNHFLSILIEITIRIRFVSSQARL